MEKKLYDYVGLKFGKASRKELHSKFREILNEQITAGGATFSVNVDSEDEWDYLPRKSETVLLNMRKNDLPRYFPVCPHHGLNIFKDIIREKTNINLEDRGLLLFIPKYTNLDRDSEMVEFEKDAERTFNGKDVWIVSLRNVPLHRVNFNIENYKNQGWVGSKTLLREIICEACRLEVNNGIIEKLYLYVKKSDVSQFIATTPVSDPT